MADSLGWAYLSEDEYFVRHGWHGVRNEEQEQQVQGEVMGDLKAQLDKGQKVILEFILYKQPPNPLSNYQQALEAEHVPFGTVVLKPNLETVMERIKQRARQNDLEHMDDRRKEAEHQLGVLSADFIKPEWVIDPSNMSPGALRTEVAKRI